MADTLPHRAPSLFPRPQRLELREGRAMLTARVELWAPAELDLAAAPAFVWLERALAWHGHRLERVSHAGTGSDYRIQIEPLAPSRRQPAAAAVASQAYALCVEDDRVAIGYASAAALQYALATLTQWISLAEGAAPLVLECLALEDWPDFPQRGVMLDISRDKVPSVDTLKRLIDQLARWKVNQLQLYMEHTFAYPGHDVVWKNASPLTAEDVRELDAHCAARHIELVPNQNSFGHMQRWLVLEPYRRLAECPDGFVHPWNWSAEPYGLCATDPASLTFLEGLYDQLLPHFSSRQFNVGLDETLDLGHGRSRAACEARGVERVYLDFLQAIAARVEARGRRMQFWGDIIIKRPDLLTELPRDAIAIEWGYEADHPFAAHLAAFKRAGLDFFVCPGTSSWNSIAGRSANAIANLAHAAREGKAAGAAGLLIADWGDHGHLQPLSVSYLGLFTGAAFSWNVVEAEQHESLDLPRELDRHVFRDAASVLGRAAHELGNAYLHAGSLRQNASVLFWILIKPERTFTPAGVTRESLERTLEHLERAGDALPRARGGARGPAAVADVAEGDRVVAELTWARDLLRFACHIGIARHALPDRDALGLLPGAARAELERELQPLIERHRSLWRERNREGGLADSARRLEQVLDALRG